MPPMPPIPPIPPIMLANGLGCYWAAPVPEAYEAFESVAGFDDAAVLAVPVLAASGYA